MKHSRLAARLCCLAAALFTFVSCADGGSSPTGTSGGFTISVTPTTFSIRQGTTDTLTVSVTRTGGFTGDVVLEADSLPAGVTVSRVVIPANETSAKVVVTAAPGAEPGSASIRVEAQAPGQPDQSVPVTMTVIGVVTGLDIVITQSPLPYDTIVTVEAVPRSAGGQVITGKSVSWEAMDTAVVKFLNNAASPTQLHAWGEGQTFISAMVDSVIASVIVSVSPAPVDSVAVTAPDTILDIGLTMELGATAWDSHQHQLNRLFYWSSSNTDVVTVDEFGRVRAVGAGTAVITASADGTPGTITIVVPSPPIAGIRVTPTYSLVLVGETVEYQAEVQDQQGGIVTGQTVKWRSVDPAIATIDENTGVATAVAPGLTTIEAFIDGEPEGYGSAEILVQTPAPAWDSLWVATFPSTTIEYAMDHDGCSFSVVYSGEVRARVRYEGWSAVIDVDVPYDATVTAGDQEDCEGLFGIDGEFSFVHSTPTEQPFSTWHEDFGPGWTRMESVLSGTVAVVGPFSLSLMLEPYSVTDTDADGDGFLDRVYAPTENITLNFEPVR